MERPRQATAPKALIYSRLTSSKCAPFTRGTFAFDPGLPSASAAKNVVVKKVGRTTGLTTGVITATEVGRFLVDYQNGPAVLENHSEVTGVNGPFAAHGDSGSLAVNERGAVVGLLFAVSETSVAYANPIGTVLGQLRVALV